MAILSLPKNIVYWKIEAGNIDISRIIAPYVASIRIKNTILPKSKKSRDQKSPTTATISFVSPNYIEDIFGEGIEIDIYLGYTLLTLTHVFSGIVLELPEGNAQEMIEYNVKAYASESKMNLAQVNRTYNQVPSKSGIVTLIAMLNGYTPNVQISDTGVMKAQYIPIQRQETDLQFLNRCALAWNCILWFTFPKTLNFVDAKLAHKYSTYNLGYRTDSPGIKNNVEKIAWKHNVARANSEINLGVTGYNEDGESYNWGEFQGYDEKRRKVIWSLKPEVRQKFKVGDADWVKILYVMSKKAVTESQIAAIRTFFRVVKYADNSSSDAPPAHDDSGFNIIVTLNEGDPDIFPPVNALLYAGSVNPRADSARPPQWLFKYGIRTENYRAELRVNTHNLVFDRGVLRSDLECSIGMFS